MTSTKIVGALVALVVVVGGYMAWQSKDAVMETPTGDTTASPSGKKMAFSELIKQGGTYKCSVSQYVGEIETKGTAYINKGMVRADYTTDVPNYGSVKSNVIVRDGYTYAWTSASPTAGVKSKVSADVSGDTGAAASGKISFNTENIGDYNCEEWSADASVFAIPSSVTFTELKS